MATGSCAGTDSSAADEDAGTAAEEDSMNAVCAKAAEAIANGNHKRERIIFIDTNSCKDDTELHLNLSFF